MARDQEGARRDSRPRLELLEDRTVPALLASEVLPLVGPRLPDGGIILGAVQGQDLLARAAAASSSTDAIIAVVDRGGRILGVRIEGDVSPAITGNANKLVFAVDGAVAVARTAAFFSNNQAPLTSRTIRFISQSTITQREVESDPSITDPYSPLRGPGFVAPIGPGGHFPPGVQYTPQVDLFAIEHTNRDTTVMGRQYRFNIDGNFIPDFIKANNLELAPPDSFGSTIYSGLNPNAIPRGIGTLPGGIPIYNNGVLVGGIGVFFPGQTGYANEENSILSSDNDPNKPDRSIEAEYIAFAAAGGVAGALDGVPLPMGISPLPNVSGPLRIDLVGITVDVIGPGGTEGPSRLLKYGAGLGTGSNVSGANRPVAPGLITQDGKPVPEGWLVTPHAGSTLTAGDVYRIIDQAIVQAKQTRAAIRLDKSQPTSMVLAVTDLQTGEVLGLYRMADSTVFSIDVAVAKARNVAYYADPTQLQPADFVEGVPAGTAFTNRTFRYLALPRFPEGIDGEPAGPFSIYTDGGIDPATGFNIGAPLPASAFQSVMGYDAFNPGTNFRQIANPLNQNGIVFFPGSAPLYQGSALIGGFGVSGDGVDQDDVVTTRGQVGFEVPLDVFRADQVSVRGVRLLYQKYNRQPRL